MSLLFYFWAKRKSPPCVFRLERKGGTWVYAILSFEYDTDAGTVKADISEDLVCQDVHERGASIMNLTVQIRVDLIRL
jgi:hypothetical protein